MYNIKNLLNNQNIKIISEKANIKILEHQKDLSVQPQSAFLEYFAAHMNVKKRQAFIALDNSSFTISSGKMQWTIGNVSAASDVKGVGDFLGKALKGAVTNESAVKPKYQGTGYLMLEPTYKYIIIEDISNWAGGIVLEDGMFLGCDGNVEQNVIARTNLSSAVLGNEGLFNLKLSGNGLAILESPVPREELIEIELDNDEIRIDGSYAVAWSGNLEFRVEKSTKSLLGSAVSGEGFVNVYRGTGKILMSPLVPKAYANLQTQTPNVLNNFLK